MLSGLFNLIGLAVSIAAALFAFGLARAYVRQRLRFVDAVRHPLAPWAVATGAVLVAAPIVWLLPIVGGGTALIFGAASGLGTASGVKALKRGE